MTRLTNWKYLERHLDRWFEFMLQSDERIRTFIPDPVIFRLALPHEWLHYLPARLLGMEANLGIGITWVLGKRTAVWKQLIVLLFPLFASMVLLAVTLFGCDEVVSIGGDRVLWLLGIGFSLGWILGCAMDVRTACRLIRRHQLARRNISLDRLPHMMWVKQGRRNNS